MRSNSPSSHSRVRRISLLTTLAAIVLLGCSQSVFAQWASSGADIHNTNSGSVGIGTSTPNALLDLNKSQNAGTTVIVDNGYTTASNAAYSGILLKQSGSSRFFLASVNDNNNTQTGGSGAVQLWNFANAPMLFAVNSTEAMRIAAGGSIGIGTTAPGTFLGGISGSGRIVHVANTSGHAQLFVTASGSGNLATVNLEVGDATATKRVFQTRYEGANNIVRSFFFNEATGAVTQDNVLVLKNDGNVGIGTSSPAAKLNVNGSINVSGNINAKYQDVAEWVSSSQTLLAGTVVVLDATRSNEVIASSQAYDTKVAGAISTMPGIALGERGPGKVLVATSGRVRIKVDATRSPIHVGDLLVTSDTTGCAMKSEPVLIAGRQFHSPGTLIGKALEPLEKGAGEILVLLSLQ